MSYRINPFTGQFDSDGAGRFASMSEAPSAADYGVGPAWIGGVQTWSDGFSWRTSKKLIKSEGVYDDSLRAALEEAQQGYGLVDVFLLSDSNTALGGYGWDSGFQAAFADIGMVAYGTGFVSANENNGNGAGTGYNFNYGGPLLGAATGADEFCVNSFTELSVAKYAYLASDTDNSGGALFILQPIAGGINDTWNFRVSYAKWASGGGSFIQRVRLAQSPYSTIADSESIACTGGDVIANADLQATVSGITNTDHQIEYGLARASAVTAKAFFSYMSAHRTNPDRGFGASVMYGTGGKKISDVENETAALTSIRRAAMLMHARQRQLDLGRSPKILIILNYGMNDKAISVSQSAFAKSTVNVMQMITAGYVANGGIHNELHWLLMPSHRITDNDASPDQALLNSYSIAADKIAESWPRCGSANLSRLMTAAEATASDWYDSNGSDTAHLLFAGNRELARRALLVAAGAH